MQTKKEPGSVYLLPGCIKAGVYVLLMIEFAGFDNIFRREYVIQLLLAHQFFLQNQFVDTFTGLESCFGQFSRCLVTQIWIQSRNQSDAVVNQFAAPLFISCDACHATITLCVHAIAQQINAFKQAVNNNWFHHVQLQLTCLSRQGNGQIIADNLECYLVNYLGDNRIYFAGHN